MFVSLSPMSVQFLRHSYAFTVQIGSYSVELYLGLSHVDAQNKCKDRYSSRAGGGSSLSAMSSSEDSPDRRGAIFGKFRHLTPPGWLQRNHQYGSKGARPNKKYSVPSRTAGHPRPKAPRRDLHPRHRPPRMAGVLTLTLTESNRLPRQ